MRSILLIPALLSVTLLAQQSPKTMTKVEVILQSADAPAGSFAAKPKVIYRAGNRYCRIEEAPDPDHDIHGVVIINEPNFWMVNLATKTAQHGVDPGPSFNCRLPLFANQVLKLPENEGKKLGELEFGQEMEFFQKNGVTPQKGPLLQSKDTRVYRMAIGDSSVALFTYGTPERPLSVAWRHGDENVIYWYSGFGQLDFDVTLFSKPEHVKVEDTKPQ